MLEPQTNKEEEFSYVAKPSNPNILFAVPRPKVTTITTTTTASPEVVRGEVLEDDDEEGGGGEEVVQKKVKIVEEYPPERPPERKTEDAYVRELENFIAPLLREALAPVYDTLGMIEQDSGKRQFFRFAGKDLSPEQRMTPIVWGCATVEEFFKKNKHLGDVIIGNLKQYIKDNKRKIEREEQNRKRQIFQKRAKEKINTATKQSEDIIKKLDTTNQLISEFKKYIVRLRKSNLGLAKRLTEIERLQNILATNQKKDMEQFKAVLKSFHDKIDIPSSSQKKSQSVYKKKSEGFKPADKTSLGLKVYNLIGATEDDDSDYVPSNNDDNDDDDNYDNDDYDDYDDDSSDEDNTLGVTITLTPEQKMAIKSIFPSLLITGLVVENAPPWLQSQISTSVLQFLLDRQSLGALNMGAQELGYPLRDLLFSDEVNYMFAQFVSAKFAKPKSNVYASGVNGGGEVHYRISSGAIINQQQTTWLLGCRRWFKENVYYGVRKEEVDLSYETPEEYREEAHRLAEAFAEKAKTTYADFKQRKQALIDELLELQPHNPNFYNNIIEVYRKVGPQTEISDEEPFPIQNLPTNDLRNYVNDLIDWNEDHHSIQEKFRETQAQVRYLLNFADILDTRMLRVRKKN